jgi:hypothetical protein
MKKMILNTIVLLAATVSQATTIKSEKLEVTPSSVDKIFRLVDKPDPGSSHKKLQILVTDHGMSTDVSPRHSIYLGYQSNAEMGNIAADFKISDQFLTVSSAKRLSGGIYEVTGEKLNSGDGPFIQKVIIRIDATKMFSDENALRKNCGDDFCDRDLETSVEVTEKLIK